MDYQKNITLKKLRTLDFVDFYEIKRTGFFNEVFLNLYDCNNRFCGTTKNYPLEKVEKFLKNQLLQEI